MKRYVIIVAGGSGTRFGGPVPKQFLPLVGRPVLMHTINRFYAVDQMKVVLVLPEAQQSYWHDLCEQYHFETPHSVVSGGDSRFQSVKNGLMSVTFEQGDLVGVHDGVRPLVSEAVIRKIYDTAATTGAAIPVTPVTDSVRHIEGDSSQALERASLRAVQTPQVFDAVALLKAYEVPFESFFTDDASVFEHAGGKVTLVEGETTNIKITHPIDIAIAEYILTHE